MSEALSVRRMAENEVVFREYNERVRKNFEEIIELAKEAGQDDLITEDDTPLYFYCECSDENCRKRILIKPSVYNKIHKNRMRFTLLPGHETKLIEKIVKSVKSYCVVEKFVEPSQSARTLNPTPVNNV